MFNFCQKQTWMEPKDAHCSMIMVIKSCTIITSIIEFHCIAELYDVCELLLLDINSLKSSLTQRTIEMRHEILLTDLSAFEVSDYHLTNLF